MLGPGGGSRFICWDLDICLDCVICKVHTWDTYSPSMNFMWLTVVYSVCAGYKIWRPYTIDLWPFNSVSFCSDASCRSIITKSKDQLWRVLVMVFGGWSPWSPTSWFWKTTFWATLCIGPVHLPNLNFLRDFSRFETPYHTDGWNLWTTFEIMQISVNQPRLFSA